MSTALLTFANSISMSVMSREVPRFTFIFVLSAAPTALGDMLLCSLLHGIIARPSAIWRMSSAGAIPSLAAAASISFVITEFLAASICVA